jgi:hypothetical protein
MKTAAFRRAAPRALSKTLAQDMSRLMRAALCDAVLNTDAVDGAALLIEPAPQPLAPARLASGQPGDAAARGRARAMYERCLANYRAAARAADGACGLDDVGVAIAHFVAANMRALHDVQITPDMLLRLQRQLVRVAQHTSAWNDAATSERQFYFEQMAILAVLIHQSTDMARAEGPAAVAHVQRAARGYLFQLLGIDGRELQLDALGLRPVRRVSAASSAAV